MRVVCLLFSEPNKILEIAEACYRLTPQIAIRENEAIFLEIESCKRLYSEKGFLLRLQALLRRFNVRAKIALGDNVFMSLAFARLGRTVLMKDLPLEALYDIANPFQRDEGQHKVVENMILEFDRLGLKNIDDFLKLSPKSLSSRFQRHGLDIHRRLRGETEILWPTFVPLEKIQEVIDLEDSQNCATLEPLLFIIKNAVGRAMARLAGRGERLSKSALHFELEKFSTTKNSKRSWIFNLPLSQGAVTGLLPIIQERLNLDLMREPLQSSVVKINFEVLESTPGQYFQRHFFNKKEEEQEAWNSLITRLCEKLGRVYTRDEGPPLMPQAFVAEPVQHYKPEKTWRRSIIEREKSEEPLGGLYGVDLPLPHRPLRLLQKPRRLFKQGDKLIPAEDLSHGLTKSWEMTDWEGPERLSGEWWGEEFKRDYFRVGTKSGEQLWIFRIPNSDQVFLHGYFD